MKKIIIIIFLTISYFEISAQLGISKKQGNQDRPENLYVFSFTPSDLLISRFSIGIERKMDDRFGLLIQGSVGFRNISLWEGLEGSYREVRGRLELKRYFRKRQALLKGVYSCVWLNMYNASVTATLAHKEYKMVTSIGGTMGGGLGYRFNLIGKMPDLMMDIQLGGGYRSADVKGRYAEKSRSIIFKDKGIVPYLSLQLAIPLGKQVGKQEKFGKKPKTKSSATPISQIKFYDSYTQKTRKEIEKALKKEEFKPGRADGNITKKTIKAIMAFQKSRNLKADGLVGKDTARKLGVALK